MTKRTQIRILSIKKRLHVTFRERNIMPFTQEEVVQTIPAYLRQFVVEQDYSSYTPQDHAVWRYIMRRNVHFLKDIAHDKYLTGLEKTGITLEKIPDINEMNACLYKIGWKAVVVDGFVPPATFMEFQALNILVISAEMRNIKNILYTPAPDIVHEAAGHAPIIADPEYSKYLSRFGEYGMRSVFSKIDYEIFEAIRYLSIIKEYPNTTEDEVKRAEKDLEDKLNANTNPSESNLLSRMHWWTVEYGLSGTPDNFKIFGAGLLSSVGESKHCLSEEVKKLPLTIDCVNYNYDITEMQPQLFAARDFEHLNEVLEEFADTMCFRKGGLYALNKVKASANVGTYIYSSGLQVSGVIDRIIEQNGEVVFIKTSSETQLSLNDSEIPGHGTNYHSDGFSSPVGKLIGSEKPLEEYDEADLLRAGIVENSYAEINFSSGITVKGHIDSMMSHNGKLILITFSDCHVTHGSEVFFEPSWGDYDMAVGAEITSAYSGSADKEKFNVYPPKSDKKAIKVIHSDKQTYLFGLYSKVRVMREGHALDSSVISEIVSNLNKDYPDEWLLRLEILELLTQHDIEANLSEQIHNQLIAMKSHSETYDNVISAGLDLI